MAQWGKQQPAMAPGKQQFQQRPAARNYTRPEQALEQARKLMRQDMEDDALSALYDFMTQRLRRVNWTPLLDDIMKLVVELGVKRRDHLVIKECIHPYKNTCLTANQLANLDVTINNLLKIVEDGAMAAKETSDVFDEKRVQSVKFAWEIFRVILDLVRNSLKLQRIYLNTTKRAFIFCKEHERSTEFHALCRLLRDHYVKYQQLGTAADLEEVPTLTEYLEIRVLQLKYALHMKLWNEAFLTADIDVYPVMQKLNQKASVPPKTLASYYSLLSELFYASEMYHFHSAALYNYFNLAIAHNKGLSEVDRKKLASQLLLSVLCTPEAVSRNVDGLLSLTSCMESRKLALLAGLSSSPTREQLLTWVTGKGVLASVLPEVKSLYQLLETEFDPLHLAQRVSPLISWLEKQDGPLSKYTKLIKQKLLLRVVKQLSTVYQTIDMARFVSLCGPYSKLEVECLLMTVARKYGLSVRIDHLNNLVHMPMEVFEKERMARHMTDLSSRLSLSIRLLQEGGEAEKRKAIMGLAKNIQREQKELLARKTIIEQRKQEDEEQARRREYEKDQRAREQLKKAEEEYKRYNEAESLRISQERERREAEHQQALEKEIKKERLRSKGIVADENELGNIDLDKVNEEQSQQQTAERTDAVKRQSQVAKKYDHWTRATRSAERPILKAAYETDKKAIEESIKKFSEMSLTDAKKKHQEALELKHRLGKMETDASKFETRIKERLGTTRKAALEEYEAKKNELLQAKVAKYMEKLRAEEADKKEKRRQQEEAAAAEERKREAEDRRRAEDEDRKMREREERESSRQKMMEEENRRRAEQIPKKTAYQPPSRREDRPSPEAAPRSEESSSWRSQKDSRPDRRDRPAREEAKSEAAVAEPARRPSKYVPPSQRGEATRAPASEAPREQAAAPVEKEERERRPERAAKPANQPYRAPHERAGVDQASVQAAVEAEAQLGDAPSSRPMEEAGSEGWEQAPAKGRKGRR